MSPVATNSALYYLTYPFIRITRVIYDYKKVTVKSNFYFFLFGFFCLSLFLLTNSVAYCDPTLRKKLIYLVEEVNLTTLTKELKLNKLIGRPVLRSTFHPLNTDGLRAFLPGIH